MSEVRVAVRAAAPHARVLLHADPEPWRVGADPGIDPATAASVADGLVVPAAGVAQDVPEHLLPSRGR